MNEIYDRDDVSHDVEDRIATACAVGDHYCLVRLLDLYELHGDRTEHCAPLCTICSARVHSFCNRAIFPEPDVHEVYTAATVMRTPISKKAKKIQNLCAACHDILTNIEKLNDDQVIQFKYYDSDAEKVDISKDLWEHFHELLQESWADNMAILYPDGVLPIYRSAIKHMYIEHSIPAFRKLIYEGTGETPILAHTQIQSQQSLSADMTDLTQRSDFQTDEVNESPSITAHDVHEEEEEVVETGTETSVKVHKVRDC